MVNNKPYIYLADHGIIVDADFTTFSYPAVTAHLQQKQSSQNYSALIIYHALKATR